MQEFPEFEYPGDNFSLPVATSNEYDSVLVGLAPELLNYDHLTSAFRVLISHSNGEDGAGKRSSPVLLATHCSQYIRTSEGQLSLGPGPFVRALEAAMPGDKKINAGILGKPTRAFFERVLESLNVVIDSRHGAEETHKNEEISSSASWKGSDIAIIGDDVNTDLGEGAIELGFWRVLGKRSSLYQQPCAHIDFINLFLSWLKLWLGIYYLLER